MHLVILSTGDMSTGKYYILMNATDLELMYLCTGTTLKVDSTVTKLPKIDGCCSDAADPDYVEEDGTFLYSHLCDVPVSISMYSTLSTVVIDAWDFHRGVHVRADLFNSMDQLQSLTLKGVIIRIEGLSTEQILNVPSLEVLQLLYIDVLRGLDIQPVLDRLTALQVLKIKAFTVGIPDQPINLSGLSQLETAVICYYMQILPIVSSNNSKLSTLKVKRYRPENAVNVGGSELDEELIEWTALPSDQCIHSVDWSCLKDTALSTLELHGVFDRSDDGSYINPDWLDTLLSKQQLQSISLQYICTDGQVEGEQAAYSYSD